MSGGLGSLSDDALLSQLRASGFGGNGPAGAVSPAPSPLSGLSDDDLMRQLGATRAPAARPSAPPSFEDRFAAAPMSGETDISSPLGAGLRAAADERLVGKPDARTPFLAALYRGGNAVGLNAPRNIAAGIATGLGQAPWLNYPERSFSENYDLSKDQEEAFARQAPKSALAGTIAGIGAGAVALPGLGGAASMGGRIAQGAATGAGYGALGELLDTKDIGKAAGAGAIGGAIGGVAVPVVSYVGKAAQAMAPWVQKGISFTNARGEYTPEAKAALSRAGIHPDLVPRRQLDDAIATTFGSKGVSEAAAREAAAAEFAIPLSRGQSTGDEAAQQFEAAAAAGARGKKAETVAQEFETQQRAAIDAARQRLDTTAGRGVNLDNPVEAAEVIADQARSRLTRSTLEADTAQQGADEALMRLRGGAPLDEVAAARTVSEGLRGKAAEAKSAYQEGYRALADLPGEFHPQAFDGIGSRIEAKIGPDVPINPVLTPQAARALDDMNNFGALLKLPEGVGPTAQQVENVRKRLSAYYPATAQNPTDRMALGRIREAFDEQAQTLAEIGRFGPRREPVGRAGATADNFPGLPPGAAPEASQAIPDGAISVGAVKQGEPESLVRYLARTGIPLDAEARAADLNRLYVPGRGALARNNAPSWDDLRVRLTEEGFFPYDEFGGASEKDVAARVLDAIHAERTAGRPTYRMDDEARAGGQRALDRVASENADNAAEVERQVRRITIDMEGYGLRPQDLDRAALNDAAEAMLRGEADDAATAYDRAVARRGQASDTAPSRAAETIDDAPFPEMGEGFSPPPPGTALPSASPEGAAYAETAAKARQLFRAYQQTFRPQGAGDDVGRAMRDVIERGREDVETARALYSGNPGLNMRMADRVKSVVGENSDAWKAHQQGYLSSILNGRDMSPQAISTRIEAALSGPRRGLTSRVLTDDQVSGLRFFQGATAQARLAREGVPDWVSTLGRTDFDPNSIMSNLFGAGVPGARPGSSAYASSLKKFVGEDSAEWSGLRQAAWRRLTGSDDGKTSLGPEAMADRIIKFTKGPGSGLAKQMFAPSELGEMERYATALRFTFKPDGSLRSADGGQGAKIASHALNAIAVALGFKLAGPAGAAGAAGLRIGQRVIEGGLAGRKAVQSFNGGAPRLAAPGPISDFTPVGVGSGLAAEYGL